MGRLLTDVVAAVDAAGDLSHSVRWRLADVRSSALECYAAVALACAVGWVGGGALEEYVASRHACVEFQNCLAEPSFLRQGS